MMRTSNLQELIVGIKGAGEMATGIAWRLFQANFKHIFMMEIENPIAVRRQVSFCEAIYKGVVNVEGVEAKILSDINHVHQVWEQNSIPVLIDRDWNAIETIRPHIVIDAIIAKKNLGTMISDAPLVIGLGPGFEAGKDVHIIVETNRGHNLGKLIYSGVAEKNTGTPGSIRGLTTERVLRAPIKGVFNSKLNIGMAVQAGDIIGMVDDKTVITEISGVLRGLIKSPTMVTEGLKLGDIDPRGDKRYCNTISDKARAISGGVLEAVLKHFNTPVFNKIM